MTGVFFRVRVLETLFLEPVAVGFADFFTFAIVVFGTLSLFAFALTLFAVAVFLGFAALPAEDAARLFFTRLFFTRLLTGAARFEPESRSSTAVADVRFFVETRLAVGFLLTFRASDDFGF